MDQQFQPDIRNLNRISSQIQSPTKCPLSLEIDYITATFNRSGLYVKQNRKPPETTSDLHLKISSTIKDAAASNQISDFCDTAAQYLTLEAATTFASVSILGQSRTINGNEVMINPSKKLSQLASSLEIMEILQATCDVPEAMILRSQMLLLQRFEIIPATMFEKETMPCMFEICLEDDELFETVLFTKLLIFITMIFTIKDLYFKIIQKPKQVPPVHEISDTKIHEKPYKFKFIFEIALMTTLTMFEFSMLFLPAALFSKVLCN